MFWSPCNKYIKVNAKEMKFNNRVVGRSPMKSTHVGYSALHVRFVLSICTRLVELYGTIRLQSVRYAPYLLNYGVLP
jgi:hypothetical protein